MEVTLEAFQKRYQYKSSTDLLGKGGFSDVYKAWDTQDEQFVALKIATSNPSEKYNLANEVKKIKRLRHPNLIEYYEIYEVSSGTKDIHGNTLIYQVAVMEYAEGGTFADLLKTQPLNTAESEDIAQGIIEGLAYLHTNNIAHRDLKPANILLTNSGGKRIPKITDFGIAKRTDATAASTQLVGTVEYMAPEFFSTGNITPAADVWSLGVMLLEALTGTHPFGKTTQGISNEQIIANILNKDLGTATQNLRSPFKEIITRCLLREINLRPQSANELKGLLQQKGDAFSEKTQVLGAKTVIQSRATQEPKWRRWGKAMFDFDVSNGRLKKVLAREFIAAILLIPLLLIISALIWLSSLPINAIRINRMESKIKQNTALIDSLKKTNDVKKANQKELSEAYFHWKRTSSDELYTPLGAIYEDRYSIGDCYHKSNENVLSYTDYAESLKAKILLEEYLEVQLPDLRRHKYCWEKNYNGIELDMIQEVKSIENLALDTLTVFFVPYLFDVTKLPSEISKRLSIPGWIQWFLNERANHIPRFKEYLARKNANTPKNFSKLLTSEILLSRAEYRGVQSIPTLANEITDLRYRIQETKNAYVFSISMAVGGFFLFILLYPVRLFITAIIFSIKALQ